MIGDQLRLSPNAAENEQKACQLNRNTQIAFRKATFSGLTAYVYAHNFQSIGFNQ